jgi:hypothetical protein
MTATVPTPRAGSGTPRLSLSSVGDLVDAYEPDVLAAMQADAALLATRGGIAAAAWQCLADGLGAACAIAEYERRTR